jgi:ABC-type multidrug transport system fused ATPase/permease subunit
MPASTYQQRLNKYTDENNRLNRQLGWLSFIRLVVFAGIIGFGYYYLVKGHPAWLIIAIIFLVIFLYCLRLYDVIKAKADFVRALAGINEAELEFLEEGLNNQPGGEEYIDPHHPYSYDLDLFGKGSLYQHLNRATTQFGRSSLAHALLHPDTASIVARQVAIRELKTKLDFRQEIQAAGSVYPVEDRELERLKSWLASGSVFKESKFYLPLLIFPLATITLLVSYLVGGNEQLLTGFFFLFALNLVISFSFARNMIRQISISGVITRVLQQFANQLKRIEKESFQAPLLRDLQARLGKGDQGAFRYIQQLASLFKYLDFLLNLVVSVFLNGFFLFHILVLYALDKWKRKHASAVMEWLELVGEFESMNSLANFSFNNEKYAFPGLLDKDGLWGTALGHPLIRSAKRICNDISFEKEKFIVLTGSNMSGKSTFLRTLGINLVLARAGSAVCAESFYLFPYDLHVSMRISDSLQDSESLFYAELKRLQGIIGHLQSDNRTFVILDEILKGTNSQDKHNGTAGLITKLARYRAYGIIATHDLTIADMTAAYPGYMANKCFESVIHNDELIFDYKLKNGICSRLNASFLMKRMGIID